MNKDSFSYELSKLVVGYIDDELKRSREFVDNPYHYDASIDRQEERIDLLHEYAKYGRFPHGIEMILDNPLFEIDKEELFAHGSDKLYLRHVYNNIQMIYEELKALGSMNKI